MCAICICMYIYTCVLYIYVCVYKRVPCVNTRLVCIMDLYLCGLCIIYILHTNTNAYTHQGRVMSAYTHTQILVCIRICTGVYTHLYWCGLCNIGVHYVFTSRCVYADMMIVIVVLSTKVL